MPQLRKALEKVGEALPGAPPALPEFAAADGLPKGDGGGGGGPPRTALELARRARAAAQPARPRTALPGGRAGAGAAAVDSPRVAGGGGSGEDEGVGASPVAPRRLDGAVVAAIETNEADVFATQQAAETMVCVCFCDGVQLFRVCVRMGCVARVCTCAHPLVRSFRARAQSPRSLRAAVVSLCTYATHALRENVRKKGAAPAQRSGAARGRCG